MTATTLTLTDFLLARIDEDESLVVKTPPSGTFRPWELTQIDDSRSWDLLAMSHRRVLAECEAKRRIVEQHPLATERPICKTCTEWLDGDYEPWPCLTLRALAAVYADRPDYRQEWRP